MKGNSIVGNIILALYFYDIVSYYIMVITTKLTANLRLLKDGWPAFSHTYQCDCL